jgi:citronellyl-CoA dehydrogenase
MQYTPEHIALQDSVRHFIDREITPNIAAWEKDGIFPAHELFAKMGKMGFLGVNKPVELAAWAWIILRDRLLRGDRRHRHQGVSMGIAVQTDMATPALARFGSDALRHEFLVLRSRTGLDRCVRIRRWLRCRLVKRGRAGGDDYIISGSRCGSPTARRPTGCACWSTRPMIPRIATSR